MSPTHTPTPRRIRPWRTARRGFNLVEMLIALVITATLLTATMVALDASFMAYQATTEEASTHTISRLIMNRMLTLIRTGREFGPFPVNPQDSLVQDDFIQFLTPNGEVLELRWVEVEEALYVIRDPGGLNEWHLLLEGVVRQDDPNNPGDYIRPFTLEYKLGRRLYRATIDLTVVPDDNMSVTLDGDNQRVIRLVASAMPRTEVYLSD
ncbi:MAG: prepilin-type N-terminal cleavage/methylation domain-containing protein [Planctomycetota bacterium]|nr:prepilin-type N-terminal cleavage/methylation domain-containing protein [Planctomycetota bacterium]MCZ6542044.1 prepilin-type N-terminal cleavage/methylation domain-containing protein [Planctomycetota bacterium]MCZ6852237.1 prepilin-type N-terminal cleavage/methylation domain-containing protein [Planctomycetota bacterium]